MVFRNKLCMFINISVIIHIFIGYESGSDNEAIFVVYSTTNNNLRKFFQFFIQLSFKKCFQYQYRIYRKCVNEYIYI